MGTFLTRAIFFGWLVMVENRVMHVEVQEKFMRTVQNEKAVRMQGTACLCKTYRGHVCAS